MKGNLKFLLTNGRGDGRKKIRKAHSLKENCVANGVLLSVAIARLTMKLTKV